MEEVGVAVGVAYLPAAAGKGCLETCEGASVQTRSSWMPQHTLCLQPPLV